MKLKEAIKIGVGIAIGKELWDVVDHFCGSLLTDLVKSEKSRVDKKVENDSIYGQIINGAYESFKENGFIDEEDEEKPMNKIGF